VSTPVIGTGVLTRACLAEILSLSSGQSTPSPLGTLAIHLFANPVSPSIDTPLSALTECTFDGYASEMATMSGPTVDLAGDTVLTPTVVPSFGCTGTVTVNQVYGWYATGPGTVASLQALGTLTPFTPGAGQQFTVKPQIGAAGNVNACVC